MDCLLGERPSLSTTTSSGRSSHFGWATPMTAAEYRARFNDLTARHRHAAQAITRTDEALAFVEPVEDDPEGYGDALYAKFPLTRPEFSF